MTTLARIAWGAFAGAVLGIAGADAAQADQASILDRGRAAYVRECASCHGQSATGNGSASWLLGQRPPDLTRFSDQTTPFPRQRIANIITGRIRLEPSHGDSEMPRWRSSPHEAGPSNNVIELEALLSYLEAIQLRKFGRYEGPSPQTIAAAGRTLFRSHCAPCHGEQGGGIASSGAVAGLAPDLTTIAARHGGIFELRGVYDAIARCNGSEGQTAMPSWERSLRRAGRADYLTMKTIEALATYVESIQR